MMISCSCYWSWSKSSLGSLSSSDSSQFSLTESPLTVSVSSATGSSSSKWAKSSSLKRFLSPLLISYVGLKIGGAPYQPFRGSWDPIPRDPIPLPPHAISGVRLEDGLLFGWSVVDHGLISSKNNKSHNENTEFGAYFFSSTFEVNFFSAFWKEIRCKDRKMYRKFACV